MTARMLTLFVAVAAVCLVAGYMVGQSSNEAEVPEARTPANEEREQRRDASVKLGDLVEVPFYRPDSSATGYFVLGTDELHTRIKEAIDRNDGEELLVLLSVLSSSGQDTFIEVADHWIWLTRMDADALEAQGLSHLDLSQALLHRPDLIAFALTESGLDPVFRRFAAQTLTYAPAEVRRSILEPLDFAEEKDVKVLTPVWKAAAQFKDPIFVDRFARIANRLDLYNNYRQSVAFAIAETPGEESRKALDAMHATEKGPLLRVLPVLEQIYAPPATGVLITNGMKPTADRIGLADIILEYNGIAVRTRDDIAAADANSSPGDVVTVKVLRDGVEEELQVTVTDSVPGHLHFDARPIVKP